MSYVLHIAVSVIIMAFDRFVQTLCECPFHFTLYLNKTHGFILIVYYLGLHYSHKLNVTSAWCCWVVTLTMQCLCVCVCVYMCVCVLQFNNLKSVSTQPKHPKPTSCKATTCSALPETPCDCWTWSASRASMSGRTDRFVNMAEHATCSGWKWGADAPQGKGNLNFSHQKVPHWLNWSRCTHGKCGSRTPGAPRRDPWIPWSKWSMPVGIMLRI